VNIAEEARRPALDAKPNVTGMSLQEKSGVKNFAGYLT
jgi:hypothetical protein